MDVANSCCNGHGNLNGRSSQAPSLLMAREILWWSVERPNVVAVVLCQDALIDEWMLGYDWDGESFNSDYIRSLDDRNEAAADEFQALLWLNIARVKGNNVATDYCWLVVEIGVPEYVAAFLLMLRNEEGMGNTNSTFSLVFLWHFTPCFCPDCVMSTLIVAAVESPPLKFCPLYHFRKFSRASSFSVTAKVCEQMCLGCMYMSL